MCKKPVVHIVDDDASVRASKSMLLRAWNLETRAYESAAAFLAERSIGNKDCILLDLYVRRLLL